MVSHKVIFHGGLAKFGEEFDLEVNSINEIISLLSMQIKGLGKFIRDGYFIIKRNGVAISTSRALHYSESKGTFQDGVYLEACMGFGDKSSVIEFTPVLQGSGSDGGIGKAIFGAILMIGAVVAAPFTGGTSIFAGISGFSFGTFGATAFAIGASMFLGGVSMMLTPSVKTQSQEKSDERPSYFLNAPINMGKEGGAEPVAFGECFCGSVVINASQNTLQLLSSAINQYAKFPKIINLMSNYTTKEVTWDISNQDYDDEEWAIEYMSSPLYFPNSFATTVEIEKTSRMIKGIVDTWYSVRTISKDTGFVTEWTQTLLR